ncbi:Holliday junction branch migration protein RuvA [Patescibacteria group bacterium]|nr:Holliday junction branch migration protein RuvA [Patescibacteria group bacterium]MBU1754698.1 Holliday junction branch migration protein RuvA [Patescibacteria group bacterium]
MIRQVRGTIVGIEKEGVVIDMAGWGVFIYVPSPELLTEGSLITLKTHLSIKQDGMDLYGFVDTSDLEFFQQLLTVSGVGPKTALSIQKRAPRENLQAAIGKRDIDYLTRVVGLGKKAAEKLSVELSEKIGVKDGVTDDEDGEVFDTLVALGYTDKEARKAVGTIPTGVSGKEARLKAALSTGAK